MFRKRLPIIFIGLCLVIAALVLGWSVFVKTEVIAPVWAPVVDDKNGETETISNEDIFDDLKDSQIFSVSKNEFKVLNKFNASELKNRSKDCGTNKNEQYFEKLLSHYSKNDNGIEYQFKY